MSRNVKYLIVIEKGPKSYGAFIPDLPGCVAVGDSRAEVKRLIREAMALHLEAMRENGEKIPKPMAARENVEAKVA
jgi:predicted RNase H-like HicB family nuclease